jgi:hypothetical protein
VQTRGGEWIVLATTRAKKGMGRQGRAFRDPGPAILLLHEMGVRKIVVDVSAWDPARAGEEARSRPDVAARQRRVHGAAAALERLLGDHQADG